MQKLYILALLVVIGTAQESFLEKQKHVKQQKDLSTEIYTIKKQGLPTFLGRSSDESIKEQLSSLLNYEEALLLTPSEETDHTIKFIESMYIIDQPNPNAVRATEKPNYSFDEPKPQKKVYNNDKVTSFKEGCIYVFSECNFKGEHAKSCPGDNVTFFGLPFEVLSIHVPDGGSLSLIQENGTTAYTVSNKCMRSRPIEFLFVEGAIQQSFGNGEIFIDQ
ncbi:unnamed protein product (macronuclear) [Paramecium tetraurelia]|uniref:Uncharacterized protein n=1 Tax=Paramecium tetraurelia TaxID=5888 RepID=A0CJQ7_PARTE|nr:uncharacterized protein GSPATT00000736001 [Paramecium tetraurelia]CAK71024.1 unnamed protein product [Paramecium tetraurelia]|eukprot:XP_001438421.1 hypothetical protein (macronuclear) [Paramecium tetraurelia strain d4-2]